jgi:hypothetical protein
MHHTASDPPEEPWHEVATRLPHHRGRTFFDLRDQRIHLADILNERFQRLIEVILEVHHLGQVLRLPVQLRGSKHRDREMGAHVNQFGVFGILIVVCLVYHYDHYDPRSRMSDIRIVLLNARVLPQGIAHRNAENGQSNTMGRAARAGAVSLLQRMFAE